MQHYNCFLPGSGPSGTFPSATKFTLTVCCPYFDNFYIVKTLNRFSYLHLVGFFIHLKRVCIQLVSKMHSLFGYQRLNYNIMIIHDILPVYFNLFTVQKRLKCILSEQHLLLIADVAGIKVANSHDSDLRYISC